MLFMFRSKHVWSNTRNNCVGHGAGSSDSSNRWDGLEFGWREADWRIGGLAERLSQECWTEQGSFWWMAWTDRMGGIGKWFDPVVAPGNLQMILISFLITWLTNKYHTLLTWYQDSKQCTYYLETRVESWEYLSYKVPTLTSQVL